MPTPFGCQASWLWVSFLNFCNASLTVCAGLDRSANSSRPCLTGHERFPLAPEHESRFAVKREGARGPEVDVRLGLDPDA